MVHEQSVMMQVWIALHEFVVETLEEANEIAASHSARNIVSADDPPVFMSDGMSPTNKLPSWTRSLAKICSLILRLLLLLGRDQLFSSN